MLYVAKCVDLVSLPDVRHIDLYPLRSFFRPGLRPSKGTPKTQPQLRPYYTLPTTQPQLHPYPPLARAQAVAAARAVAAAPAAAWRRSRPMPIWCPVALA